MSKILDIRCTSLYFSWKLNFFSVLINFRIFQGNWYLDISRFFLENSVLIDLKLIESFLRRVNSENSLSVSSEYLSIKPFLM